MTHYRIDECREFGESLEWADLPTVGAPDSRPSWLWLWVLIGATHGLAVAGLVWLALYGLGVCR